ncbi:MULTISPECIES: hypothetical protein [unclassified Variovorax]|uniref:hypothetical protein n=1 Tax=unclassified Variovorax TaxID=663243 RepID=UPI0032E717A3
MPRPINLGYADDAFPLTQNVAARIALLDCASTRPPPCPGPGVGWPLLLTALALAAAACYGPAGLSQGYNRTMAHAQAALCKRMMRRLAKAALQCRSLYPEPPLTSQFFTSSENLKTCN